MPNLYLVQGPYEGYETDCYICEACGCVYEDGPKNVCAAKVLGDLKGSNGD